MDDDHLFAACARLAREEGWPAEQRDRLARLLADEGRRRALFEHPRRMEFLGRVLAEMVGDRGAVGHTGSAAPGETAVRVVAHMMAEELATPG